MAELETGDPTRREGMEKESVAKKATWVTDRLDGKSWSKRRGGEGNTGGE